MFYYWESYDEGEIISGLYFCSFSFLSFFHLHKTNQLRDPTYYCASNTISVQITLKYPFSYPILPPNVDLIYSNVYLVSPLGCLLGNSNLTHSKLNSWSTYFPTKTLLPLCWTAAYSIPMGKLRGKTKQNKTNVSHRSIPP